MFFIIILQDIFNANYKGYKGVKSKEGRLGESRYGGRHGGNIQAHAWDKLCLGGWPTDRLGDMLIDPV